MVNFPIIHTLHHNIIWLQQLTKEKNSDLKCNTQTKSEKRNSKMLFVSYDLSMSFLLSLCSLFVAKINNSTQTHLYQENLKEENWIEFSQFILNKSNHIKTSKNWNLNWLEWCGGVYLVRLGLLNGLKHTVYFYCY